MELRLIHLELIIPNPFQPRETFEEQSLKELAESIKQGNIVQPIIVRKLGDNYQIVAGERRWRAAKIAGLKEILCIVKEMDESKVLLESLIENLHRKDLTDVERENAIHELWKNRDSLGFKTKADIGRALGIDPQKVESDIEAWEFRQKEGGIPPSTPTYIISRTSGLPIDERKKVIEKVNKGEFQAKEAYIAIKVLRKASEPLKKAILDGTVRPEVAEEITEIEQPQIREQAIEIATKGVYSADGLRTRIERLEKPRIELPSASLGEQVFNKTKWNLERIGTYDFYTVGYENKSLTQLIALLHCKKVRTLLDVRRNPVSLYKMEFNKENLRSELSKESIDYIHLPALGVPSEIRERLSITHDYNWFFDWYDSNILDGEAFGELNLMDFKSPIAIMCVEFDPTRCHRHRLALALEKRGLKGYDL
jgi:ParB family chromosome partitioning protein